MEIMLPIFLVDGDGYLYVCESHDDLASRVEPIDIETSEYQAWDSLGKKLAFKCNNGKAVAEIAMEESQIEKLLSAIRTYALKFKGISIVDDSSTDPVAAYSRLSSSPRSCKVVANVKRIFRL